MIRLAFSLCFLINVYSFENISYPCSWCNKSGSKPQKYFSSKGTCSLWLTVNVLKTKTATIIHHWNLCSLFQSLKTRGFEVQILFQKETKKVAKLCITSVVEIHQTTSTMTILKFHCIISPKLPFVFLKIADGFDLITSKMLFASFIKHTKQKIEDTAGK